MIDKTEQEHIEDLLSTLELIAIYKKRLPANQRGWCNAIGLYVQKRQSHDFTLTYMMSRLQAGTKTHVYVDAKQMLKHRGGEFKQFDWDVKKYEPGDWETHVDPTLKLTSWLCDHGGLHTEYEDAFDKTIITFEETGNLKLPRKKRASKHQTDIEGQLIDCPEGDQSPGAQNGCGTAILMLIAILSLIALFQILVY